MLAFDGIRVWMASNRHPEHIATAQRAVTLLDEDITYLG